MGIVFAAAEGFPFIKTGGLGDVIGSLPKALQEEFSDVCVVLPLYEDIPHEFKSSMELIAEISVPLAWRNQYCGLKLLTFQGVKFYFIDNEYYFKRQGIYGFSDDGERYAFFSKAVLECLPFLHKSTEIIHCHDWHTAMVSVFLDAFYRTKPYYQHIRTILTIHNLAYQGVFSSYFLKDILGLEDEYYSQEKLEFHNGINFMKGGIIFSDLVTTVSKSYAKEILQPYYGEGLDILLNDQKKKLKGIVNGIDFSSYNPLTDQFIFTNYDTWEAKQANKAMLQESFGLEINQEIPMVGIVSRLVEQKGLDLICHINDELLQENLQLVILGTGEEKYESFFRELAQRYPKKQVTITQYNEVLARKIYSGTDMFLMPSLFEPCGLSQLIALRYGSIPIVRKTGGLKDTVQPYCPINKRGNGFSFTNYNAHELLFTIKNALQLYRQKEQWANLVQNAMACDYSWSKSAKEYADLYRGLSINCK